jgi:hypothetical protein
MNGNSKETRGHSILQMVWFFYTFQQQIPEMPALFCEENKLQK